MNPKNKKYLVGETSKRTQFSEEIVEIMLSYYWRHVRDFMQCPAETSIFLNKLGTFSLIPGQVDKFIMERELFIERMDRKLSQGEQLTKGQMEFYVRCKSDLPWLKERKEDLKEEKLKHRERKQKCNEHRKQVYIPVAKQVKDTKGVLAAAAERYED